MAHEHPVLSCMRKHMFPEDRSHMVEGIRDCALNQGSITWSRKSPLTHSHGETSDDFNSVGS